MASGDEDKTSGGPNRDPQEMIDKSKDLEKCLDPLLEEYSKILSRIFGRRINLRFTSPENRKKLLDAFIRFQETNRKIEAIDKSDLPEEEKLAERVDLIDSTLRVIAPEMTKGQHITDWSVSGLEEAIKKPATEMFFVAARYPEHSRTIDNLLNECVSKGCYDQVKQLLEEAEKGEVAFSKMQVFYARLTPAYEFLYEVFPITRMNVSLDTSFRTRIGYELRAKDSISREDIDKALQYYRDFAGEYEKQVRIIVGLLRILETGVKADYGKIKRRALGMNLGELKRSNKYNGLAAPFSRTVRNALAHSNYSVDPVEEKVRFVDRHDEVTLSFVEFLRMLADLSSLVLAIWSLGSKLMLLEQRGLRDIYRRAKADNEKRQSDK